MGSSFYLGPGKRRFTPSSWSDVVAAAEDGLVEPVRGVAAVFLFQR